jgi:hypothetical protein
MCGARTDRITTRIAETANIDPPTIREMTNTVLVLVLPQKLEKPTSTPKEKLCEGAPLLHEVSYAFRSSIQTTAIQMVIKRSTRVASNVAQTQIYAVIRSVTDTLRLFGPQGPRGTHP